MPCQKCGNRLGSGRTHTCKPCGRNQSRETRLPDGGDVYHPASSPAAANIVEHVNGIRQYFSVPDDQSDLRALSDFTNDVRDHELTQREVQKELHAIKDEYEDRFPPAHFDGTRYDPVSFEIRQALQWAESYPITENGTAAAVVTDPDGSPDHPEEVLE